MRASRNCLKERPPRRKNCFRLKKARCAVLQEILIPDFLFHSARAHYPRQVKSQSENALRQCHYPVIAQSNSTTSLSNCSGNFLKFKFQFDYEMVIRQKHHFCAFSALIAPPRTLLRHWKPFSDGFSMPEIPTMIAGISERSTHC